MISLILFGATLVAFFVAGLATDSFLGGFFEGKGLRGGLISLLSILSFIGFWLAFLASL